MDTEIISALIGAGGVIVAALIAAIGAGKIVRETASNRFHSYSDISDDATNLLVHAQNDVFIVAMVGDNLLRKYGKYLERLMDRGIHIYWLLLTEEKLKEAAFYMHGQEVDCSFRERIIKTLKGYKEKYGDLFECKECGLTMTASYLCTDIMPLTAETIYPSTAAIQIMLYQYCTNANVSPITYITHLSERKEFRTTVDSITKMWWESRELDFKKLDSTEE